MAHLHSIKENNFPVYLLDTKFLKFIIRLDHTVENGFHLWCSGLTSKKFRPDFWDIARAWSSRGCFKKSNQKSTSCISRLRMVSQGDLGRKGALMAEMEFFICSSLELSSSWRSWGLIPSW